MNIYSLWGSPYDNHSDSIGDAQPELEPSICYDGPISFIFNETWILINSQIVIPMCNFFSC